MIGRFKKITPVNGFDQSNPDNAKQNDYAWSMAELGDYIYVGTARNILYSILSNQVLGIKVDIPEILVPQNPDMNGEIWRYRKGGQESWERVYKAPAELQTFGFRFMTTYTTPDGEEALYAIAYTFIPQIIILKSTDGVNWRVLDTNITTGYSARTMVEHNGRLYMGVMDLELQTQSNTLLYVSSDPEREQWQLIDTTGDPTRNPQGEITEMLNFNGHLYVATSRPGGFELWRSEGESPQPDQWKLIVDQGAGDALNQVPISMDVFNNYIYLGTGIWLAVLSVDPEQRFVPPKGFDIIRIGTNDKWELVVGGPAIAPTQPTTGTRGVPLSGHISGFGNLSNGYCWQIRRYGRQLFIGSMDWSVTLPILLSTIRPIIGELFPYNLNNYLNSVLTWLLPTFGQIPGRVFIDSLLEIFLKSIRSSYGFDLWQSYDGIRWSAISRNGLGNQYNYGVRNLFPASDGNLYLGTANPFQGCEVWVTRRLI